VRIDLVIRAPRDARVEAAVSSGALEVTNMDAGSDLDTGSGPIWVRNVQGEVLTHSISGTTRLAQVFGSVDAQTLTSDLDLDTIGGERLIASVHHGRIDGRRVRARNVELTTTEGKIVLEAEAALRGRIVVSIVQGRRRCPAPRARRDPPARARHPGRSRRADAGPAKRVGRGVARTPEHGDRDCARRASRAARHGDVRDHREHAVAGPREPG